MQSIVIEISDTDEIPINAIPLSEVLQDIKAEIIQNIQNGIIKIECGNEKLFDIIDKRMKSEDNNVGCEDCEVTKSQEPTTKNETLVSLGVYKQVAWERDIAIQQLHELGYEFGQKIELTTKNDLAQERYQDLIEYFGDEKVAKTILESRKEFKAWLERLRWNVKRADELARELEQLKGTTKNNLGVDCIDRQATLDAIIKRLGIKNETYLLEAERVIYQQILAMPSVTSQEPFINKPCVSSTVCKHDKNKVLDKIREQIKDYLRGVEITLEVLIENDPLRPKMEGAKDTLEECLNLIDKAEAEVDNG